LVKTSQASSFGGIEIFIFKIRMEAVIQPVFGIAGFFANAVAVPVLCR
jgi:hypothetical protein